MAVPFCFPSYTFYNYNIAIMSQFCVLLVKEYDSAPYQTALSLNSNFPHIYPKCKANPPDNDKRKE